MANAMPAQWINWALEIWRWSNKAEQDVCESL
jgi:hypothetical protein